MPNSFYLKKKSKLSVILGGQSYYENNLWQNCDWDPDVLLQIKNQGATLSSPPPRWLDRVIAPTGGVSAARVGELRGFHAVIGRVVESTAGEKEGSIVPTEGLKEQTAQSQATHVFAPSGIY